MATAVFAQHQPRLGHAHGERVDNFVSGWVFEIAILVNAGFVTEHLFPVSQLLTSIITFGPQPNKAIVGENAFAHEAGIHQDGYLKNPSTYEIINPLSVGVPETRLVLGKHSGRHALKQRAEALGFALDKTQLDEFYTRFTEMADRKKGLRNDEIAALLREVGAMAATAS